MENYIAGGDNYIGIWICMNLESPYLENLKLASIGNFEIWPIFNYTLMKSSYLCLHNNQEIGVVSWLK